MSTSDVAATLAATRNGVWMAYSPRELAKLGVDYIVSDNPGSILLGADLYARIAAHVEVEEMTGITLKGIDHPVSAYVLKGFK